MSKGEKKGGRKAHYETKSHFTLSCVSDRENTKKKGGMFQILKDVTMNTSVLMRLIKSPDIQCHNKSKQTTAEATDWYETQFT